MVQSLPLPDELIVHILSMLDVWSIGNFSSTCKHAKALFKDSLLWKIIYFREHKSIEVAPFLIDLELPPPPPDGDIECWQKLCKDEFPYVGKEWIAWR